MPPNIDNEHFRALLRASPAEAIDVLYRHAFAGLVQFSESLTKNRHASLDIVQEAFIHIWQNRDALSQPNEQSIQAYLVRYVKLKSMTEYTQKMRHEELLRLSSATPLNGHTIETEIIRGEIRAELRKVISTFPRREQECLFMKLDRELNTAQIAAELNVTVKAVEKSLTSGNKRLKAYYTGKT